MRHVLVLVLRRVLVPALLLLLVLLRRVLLLRVLVLAEIRIIVVVACVPKVVRLEVLQVVRLLLMVVILRQMLRRRRGRKRAGRLARKGRDPIHTGTVPLRRRRPPVHQARAVPRASLSGVPSPERRKRLKRLALPPPLLFKRRALAPNTNTAARILSPLARTTASANAHHSTAPRLEAHRAEDTALPPLPLPLALVLEVLHLVYRLVLVARKRVPAPRHARTCAVHVRMVPVHADEAGVVVDVVVIGE
ncbi:hypothetical protein B0H14DRAFT_2695185 [Mycena olivaceomarginata]|nr:hypothetical protein B0H14DRAFT_2695185 [Mycena olivaceomarginata]